MKKKLESELLSIAHRVLKLTGKEDLNKMHNEIALLYQKISIFRFLEMESPKGNSDETQIRQEKVDELSKQVANARKAGCSDHDLAYATKQQHCPVLLGYQDV